MSYDYLDAIGGSSPILSALFYAGHQKADKLEVVLLSHTLGDRVNIGYENIVDAPIKSINGENVRDLQDLANKIGTCSEPFIRICTAEEQDVIVVPSPKHKDFHETNKRILSRYKIASDRCLDSGL